MPFPSPGDLPNPGVELVSPTLGGGLFTTEPPRKPQILDTYLLMIYPVAQMVKRLRTTRETWVRSLGWEDLLEKETATHTGILAWKIPWTEEPGRLQSMGSQRVGHD